VVALTGDQLFAAADAARHASRRLRRDAEEGRLRLVRTRKLAERRHRSYAETYASLEDGSARILPSPWSDLPWHAAGKDELESVLVPLDTARARAR
jgi:hypothetical protein